MNSVPIFLNLLENHETLTDKTTKKAEQKSIQKSDYIAPPGHISIIKTGVAEEDGTKTAHLIFHNGVNWKHGRTWDFAEDWFCLDITWSSSFINTEDLKHVQAFHVTSKSSGASMEECSTSFGYVLAAAVDLSEADSDSFEVLLFGGQSTETAITSNRLEIVSGPVDFHGPLHCKAYRGGPRMYKEYNLPSEYNQENDSVQVGTIPSSRCGHSLGKLSSDLLVCTGGLTIPKAGRHKFHPSDSNLFLLKYPEIEWIKLEKIEELDRTEHSMVVFGEKIFVVGGYSFRNHLASEIFPFSQVLEITINRLESDVFSTSLRVISLDIMPEFGEPYLTSMSSVGVSNYLYMYGGYTWPEYDHAKQNLYEMCPPYTSHNKRPKQHSILVEINLESMEIKLSKAPSEFATAGGSLQVLSRNEEDRLENLLIVGGSALRLDLYSTFSFDLKKCDIDIEYGGCEVTLSTREKELVSCSSLECTKTVHILCDKYTRGLARMTSETYLCPKCANYDPVTKKKRPKPSSGRRGRGVRRNV